MEITENRLVKRIARYGLDDNAVLRGIGDDGAVVRLDAGDYVFVQDAMVERIHFDLAIQSAYSVGRKAVYINASDVLAMGAEPRYFLSTIGVPPRISAAQIEQIYRGMRDASREFGAVLIGGDTTEAAADFFIDVSMAGRLAVPGYLGRNTARAGDLIAVTGALGESAYGLYLLKNGKKGRQDRFTRRYANPRPPFDAWKALTQAGIPRAMMDISDGLIIDLERMMAESGLQAVIRMEDLPIPAALKKEGKELFALAGGEDFQLLFSFDASRKRAVEALKDRRIAVSIIGEVKTGKGVRLLDRGIERKVVLKGYEHFREAKG